MQEAGSSSRHESLESELRHETAAEPEAQGSRGRDHDGIAMQMGMDSASESGK
jgi:hypothetical protein